MGYQGSHTDHSIVRDWLHLLGEQHLTRDPEETDSSPSGDEFEVDSDDEIDVNEINRAAFIRDSDIRNRSHTSHSQVPGLLQSQAEQYLARDPEETDSSPSGDEFDADSDDVIDVREIRAAFIRDSDFRHFISEDDLRQHVIDILESGENQQSM